MSPKMWSLPVSSTSDAFLKRTTSARKLRKVGLQRFFPWTKGSLLDHSSFPWSRESAKLMSLGSLSTPRASKKPAR
eukprot:scaffold2995_cov430-Prasinococcus_capsulatus_cf.AAC.2